MPPTPTRARTGKPKSGSSPRRATRSAKASVAATVETPALGESPELLCPECGRGFRRPAALGAHRSRAHGVRGATAKTSTAKTHRARQPRNTRAQTSGSAQGNNPTRRAGAQSTNTSSGIDRDALLVTLFPDGVPPREQVIRELSAWLDQAEKLAKLR
jgi:hypothetical protein